MRVNKREIIRFFRQAIRYGLVGVSGLLTNLTVFSFLVYIVDVWYIPAGLFAGWVSLTQNFVLHRKFSFVDQASFSLRSSEALKRYLRFFVLSVVNAPAFSSILYFLVEFIKIEKVIAQFMTSVSLGFINFLIARRFIFH